jgi:CRISPR/Cas system endoribonuclease Cas6 (RAMP superfamily)
MSKKKKRRKETFVTLSPTRIEVTGFNGSDSQIRDDEEQT